MTARADLVASLAGGEPFVPAQGGRAIRYPTLGAGAFHGVLGDFARIVEPHTEADVAALLLQALIALGNASGRGAYYQVEADRHYGNEFLALVGLTSTGRKGTSLGHVRRLFKLALPTWEGTRITSGLSSGEGVMEAVRDATERTKGGERVVEDDGVADKRLLAIQPELAVVLKVMQREGNTLSAILRDAWDGRNLGTMTRRPLRASNPHVSLIGHITQEELCRYLDATELANGLMNRYLFGVVRRTKLLPEGGNLDERDLYPVAERLTRACNFGMVERQFLRTESARALWYELYPQLEAGRPGLLGAVLARGSAHVTRLSLLYAVADCSPVIDRQHLEAAMAVWRFCEASAEHIFGDALGDPVADTILKALRAAPDGMTRTQIYDGLFSRHKGPAIGQALDRLEAEGLIRRTAEDTGGRPAERWFAVVTDCAKSAKSAQSPPPTPLYAHNALNAQSEEDEEVVA